MTAKDVYMEKFGNLHAECMDIACKEALAKAKEHGIPIACFDISALTYQHYRLWLDKEGYINSQANPAPPKPITKPSREAIGNNSKGEPVTLIRE